MLLEGAYAADGERIVGRQQALALGGDEREGAADEGARGATEVAALLHGEGGAHQVRPEEVDVVLGLVVAAGRLAQLMRGMDGSALVLEVVDGGDGDAESARLRATVVAAETALLAGVVVLARSTDERLLLQTELLAAEAGDDAGDDAVVEVAQLPAHHPLERPRLLARRRRQTDLLEVAGPLGRRDHRGAPQIRLVVHAGAARLVVVDEKGATLRSRSAAVIAFGRHGNVRLARVEREERQAAHRHRRYLLERHRRSQWTLT